jgi:putative transposase
VSVHQLSPDWTLAVWLDSAPDLGCTVHFLRDMLGHVSRAQQPLVSGAIRGIFAATTHTEARVRLGQVVEQLHVHAPKVARLLEDAEQDLLAFYGFPAQAAQHQPAGAGRPGDRAPLGCGGDLPQRRRAAAPGGMLLLEQNDEWLVGRRYLSETSLALVTATDHPDPATMTGTQDVAQLTAS